MRYWQNWKAKRRERKPKLFYSCSTLVVIAIAFFFAVISHSLFTGKAALIIGEITIGLTALIGGIIIYRTKSMSLILPKGSHYHLYSLLLPLTAIMLAQVVGTPLSSFNLSGFDAINVMVTSFWEEILFRALVFAWWCQVFGVKKPLYRVAFVAISGVFFGVLHGDGLTLTIIKSGAGIMFGMVLLQTRIVYFTMALHMLNNGLSKALGGSIDHTSLAIIFCIFSAISLWIVFKYEGVYYEGEAIEGSTIEGTG